MDLLKKSLAVSILVLASCSLLAFDCGQAVQEEKPAKIPKEVIKIIEENLVGRQTRADIPLTYLQTLYFPYQSNYFACFFLKIKNESLGYAPPVVEERKEKTKKEKKKQKEASVEEAKKILSCHVDFFFRVYSLSSDGQPLGIHKEIYLPYDDQVEEEGYRPDEENVYSFGTLFPPGRYLLSAVAASLDLSKIGLIFQEFYLPLPADFDRSVGFTPFVFVKNMRRMPSPDSVITLHKNLFHYAFLEIEPHFDCQFSPTERLDVFYLILGATPAADGKFSLEVSHAYKKGEQEVVKFEPHRLENVPVPIVSIPLPLVFVDKKLEPGEYILEISAKDKVGNKEGKGTTSFTLK